MRNPSNTKRGPGRKHSSRAPARPAKSAERAAFEARSTQAGVSAQIAAAYSQSQAAWQALQNAFDNA
jgi:hypothetical protein